MSIASTPPDPLDQAVDELRRSSRLLVRALGFMRGRSGGLGTTPAQCHSLLELSSRGRMTIGELAGVLEIDRSTASRSIQPLVSAGLVETLDDRRDGRTKPVRLSPGGKERVEAIHAAANQQVRGALELLSLEERETVLRGVSLYERALHRAKAREGIVLRPIEPRDDAALAALIRAVMTEFGAVGAGFSIEDAEVDEMHATYTRARHDYFVAERDGEVLAGGGIGPLVGADRDDICELRKMYALTTARGLGLGRALLERCLGAARDLGYRTCYLETLAHMHGARVLYEKAGFRALPGPLGDTGHSGCNGWYILDLGNDPD